MSIIYQGRSAGRISIADGRTEVRQTLVFLCNAGEGPYAVLSDSHLPEEGDSFPDIPRLKCSSILITPEKNGNHTRITAECRYSEEDTAGGLGKIHLGTIQWNRAFDVRITAAENIVPFEFSYDETDSNGNPVHPVTTSSGTPVSAVTVQLSTILRFSCYQRSFKPEWIAEFSGTVNAEQVQICGIKLLPGTALIRSLKAETVTLKGRSVMRLDVEMEISPAGFKRRFPDKSLYCLSSGVPSRIYSGYSTTLHRMIYGTLAYVTENASPDYPVTAADEPLWLNADGSAVEDQKTGTGRMLSFCDKRFAVWKVLSLPEHSNW